MERDERPGPRPKRKRSPSAAILYKLGPALAIAGLMLFGFYAICIRLAVQQVIYENGTHTRLKYYASSRLISVVADKLHLGLTYIIAFLFCQLFFWISYFRCVFSDPGRVPVPEGELEAPPPHTDNSDPDDEPKTPGYCDKCAMWKPPRAHHCM